MSNINENDQQQQSGQQPAPAPRGGGDVSGKGISDSSEDSGATDADGETSDTRNA